MTNMFTPCSSSLPVPAATVGRDETPLVSGEVGAGREPQGLPQLCLEGHEFRAEVSLEGLCLSSHLWCPARNVGKLKLCVTSRLSYDTAFAAALRTVLTLLVFSLEASHSNTFGKAFIRL